MVESNASGLARLLSEIVNTAAFYGVAGALAPEPLHSIVTVLVRQLVPAGVVFLVL